MLASGVYHGRPAPDPLGLVLFEPPGQFFIEGAFVITYRPEITPAMHRIFADRITLEASDRLLDLERLLGLGAAASYEDLDLEDDEDNPDESAPYPEPRPPTALLSLTVRLAWEKKVWRRIEILDNQTFEDLHEAIQKAFGWGNDHLYAFYLSGKRWDRLTEISGAPFFAGWDEVERPTAREVLLGDAAFAKGQRFLYLFDFGDELEHELQLTAVLPVPADGTFPRIVETRGDAPPQYPSWVGDDDGDDDEA